MTVSVTWNGTAYSIPESGETNWSNLTDFLVALGAYAQTTTKQVSGVRVATSSPVTLTTADYTVVTNLTVAGAVAVTLPTGVLGQVFVIADGKGDARTNNVTITGAGAQTINGSTYVINENYGGVVIQFNGTTWNTLGGFTGENPRFTTLSVTGAAELGSLVVTGNASITGTTSISGGLVNAPGLAFSSAGTTGIYLPAAGTFGIATVGVQAAQWDSSQNFTTGPSSSASDRVNTFRSGGTHLTTNFTSGSDSKYVALVLNQSSKTCTFGLASGSSTFFTSGETAGDIAIKAPSGNGINFGSGATKYGSMSSAGAFEMVSYTASGVAVPTISSASVLTNKDIDGGTASNTNRITIPKDTATNLNALTRKTGTLVYDTTNSVVKFDNGSSLVSMSGDTVGPASSTDNALVRFDSTTGKVIQNSTAILSDAGALSGITTLATTGNITTDTRMYVGDGSIALPSISFGADTNTGFFRNSIDSVGFSAGGSQIGQWTALGKFVIGAAGGTQVHDIEGGLNVTTTLAVNTSVTIGGVAVPTTSSTSTLTNKTLGSSNTLTGATAANFTNSGNTITLPTSTSTLATLALSETLTNKTLGSTNTLTGATAASFTNAAATVTLPTSTSTLSTLTLSETLTNKTISSPTISGQARYVFVTENVGGTFNNYAIPAGASMIRFNGGTTTLTGIAGGVDGQMLHGFNLASGANLTIANQSASSTAGNRIITGTAADVTITNEGAFTLVYDATSTAWRILSIQQ